MIKQIPLFIRLLLSGALVNVLFGTISSSFSQSDSKVMNHRDVLGGEKLYTINCSGCHLNGNNLIKPDKPIIGSKKLNSLETFNAFLSAPPPPMPNFKNITEKPDQLKALYQHVISLMGK